MSKVAAKNQAKKFLFDSMDSLADYWQEKYEFEISELTEDEKSELDREIKELANKIIQKYTR